MAVLSPTSSIFNSLIRDAPDTDALQAEHEIRLLDKTKPPEIRIASDIEDAERSNSAAVDSSRAARASLEPLVKKLTHNSLNLQESVRQQIVKQRYARYGKDRYTESSSSVGEGQHSDEAGTPGEVASSAQHHYLERNIARAKSLLRRKHAVQGAETEDTVIDILYENQRGSFLFGIPRYSSASLLPSDPKPWQNAQFRTSPVDIRNAQVPDPSWEWAWRSWYVDMSRDVDEEGWEYSFLFRNGRWGGVWHGNHPWFHSFVRRRRWLRMRRRKDEKRRTAIPGHELSPDYFTIHPKTIRSGSDTQNSPRRSTEVRALAKMEDEPRIEDMDITDIATLIQVLRRASVDRERLVAVRKFVESGGDEIYFLSQRMPEIMSLFVYQSSRRQLLADLISHHESADAQKANLADHDHDGDDTEKQTQHDAAVRRANNLHAAVEAADAQIKQLEYYSDIKGIADDAAPDSAEGHPRTSFLNKQPASDGAPALHQHAEHTTESDASPSKYSSRFFDAPTSPPSARASQKGPSSSFLGRSPPEENVLSDESSEIDRYTTAAESVGGESDVGGSLVKSPAQKGKEKAAQLTSLDGMMEEEADEAESAAREEGEGSLQVIPPGPEKDEGDVVEEENNAP